MIIVYHDYGGSHSTATAAALHLGLIDDTHTPTTAEFVKKVPLYDQLTAPDHGKLFHIGTDKKGNEIFVLPRRSQPDLVLNAVKSTIDSLNHDVDDWKFVNTIPTVNLWMRIGGFISRRLQAIWLGRPIVIHGTKKAFPKIRQLVERTKRDVDDIDMAKGAKHHDAGRAEPSSTPEKQ